MRNLTERSLPTRTPKSREIDPSNGAARQAAATRGRLRLYAAKQAASSEKLTSKPFRGGGEP
jgi:hypothetical protein